MNINMSKNYRLSKKVVLAEESDGDEEEDNLKVIDNHIYFYNDVTVKTITDLTLEIKKLTNRIEILTEVCDELRENYINLYRGVNKISSNQISF